MTPLPITCSMCGGQIEPDDLALRDELVVCPFCSTLNRITAKGTEKSAEAVHQHRRPEGVLIKKAGDELLISVHGGGTVFMPVIIPRVLIFLTITFVILFSFITINLNSCCQNAGDFQITPNFLCFSIFVILCLVFVFLAILGDRSALFIPPIKLAQDTLFASEFTNYWGKRPSVKIKDIRQLYTVAHLLQRIPSDSLLYSQFAKQGPEALIALNRRYRIYSIYALKHDGKRVLLMSKIPDRASALYVEEYLEIAAGLFNLPVYGDQNLSRDLTTQVHPASRSQHVSGVLTCNCCGALLPAKSDSSRIGYIVCEHCHVLSLLYGTGSNKPILGLPKLNSPNSQFEIRKMGKQLKVKRRHENGNASLILAKVELAFFDSPSKIFVTLRKEEINNIFAKEVELPGSSFELVDFSNQDQWEDELAHSGDLEKSYKRIHGTLFYQVIAKTTTGEQLCLLDKLTNPYEALAFVERILYLYHLTPISD